MYGALRNGALHPVERLQRLSCQIHKFTLVDDAHAAINEQAFTHHYNKLENTCVYMESFPVTHSVIRLLRFKPKLLFTFKACISIIFVIKTFFLVLISQYEYKIIVLQLVTRHRFMLLASNKFTSYKISSWILPIILLRDVVHANTNMKFILTTCKLGK